MFVLKTVVTVYYWYANVIHIIPSLERHMNDIVRA